ncbi:MAG: BadF/BadG/BcrA/BcrD ATPase family protein [Nibricoccus sp.]
MKIGVDGGGTKTELILIDDSAAIVSRHFAPGCNPSLVGQERAHALMLDALAQLVASAPTPRTPVSRTLLCMAGSQNFWSEFAKTLDGYGVVETTTDAAPVLQLATDGEPGLALHAGTGSFVVARTPEHGVRYAGGLGWRIGDPGSANDIGRRAAARALAEMQGWAEKSAVGDAFQQLFNTANPASVTAELHQSADPNKLLGSFAQKVSELAASGDSTAVESVLASCFELLDCAEAVAGRFFSQTPTREIRTGLSGPILTQPFVVKALSKRTTLPLRTISAAPIEGLRQLLAKR